jgi:hypothetical protein
MLRGILCFVFEAFDESWKGSSKNLGRARRKTLGTFFKIDRTQNWLWRSLI